MPRRSVTYVEAGSWGARAGSPPLSLAPSSAPARPPSPGDVPRWRLAAAAAAAAVALLGASQPWSAGAPPAEPPAPEDPAPVEQAAVAIDPASVVDPPWRAAVEHHVDARGSVAVPLVHVLGASRDDGGASVLFVADATGRAGADEATPVRLGDPEGTGLRTEVWDEGGFAISMTALGLTVAEHERLARALRVAHAPSAGRAPTLDLAVLDALGMAVTGRRSGPASASGSPLIGQGGGASLSGVVRDDAGRTALLSVVDDQVLSAWQVRRSLGPRADLGTPVPAATSVAVLAHPGAVDAGGPVRGQHRVLLDHATGVTVALASDDLALPELLALARALDLDLLAGAVAR